MKKLDDETRRAIATGWNPHVQTMKEYAASVGVSERAVRKYRARFGAGAPEAVPAERAAVPLLAALDALQDRLGGLEAILADVRAALADARAAVAACRTGTATTDLGEDGTTARAQGHDDPAQEQVREQVVPAVVQARPAPRGRPVRGSFFSEFP